LEVEVNSVIVFLAVVLVGAIVFYAMIVARAPRGRSHGGRSQYRDKTVAMNRGEVFTRWQAIMATSEGGAGGLKSALNDADKLFDNVLRSQNFRGDTMGERLKSARPRFSDYSVYDGIWRAHKLRNSMAHDIGFDLVASQAKEALRDFERGLKSLGAL
jgi:hypothetical protein